MSQKYLVTLKKQYVHPTTKIRLRNDADDGENTTN